jgi:MOSC domain-containing protein
MGQHVPVTAEHLTAADLRAGLDDIRQSPPDGGRVHLIVRRPGTDERELLDEAALDCVEGLVGDTWHVRGSSRTPDGSAHPGMQLTLMNSRAAALIAGSDERRPLAGDQLYVDLDLSHGNLPSGTQLAIGSAVVEVTDQPHLGCKKFAARFGVDALRLVNSEVGRELRLRGANARVVVPGTVRVGDEVRKRKATNGQTAP